MANVSPLRSSKVASSTSTLDGTLRPRFSARKMATAGPDVPEVIVFLMIRSSSMASLRRHSAQASLVDGLGARHPTVEIDFTQSSNIHELFIHLIPRSIFKCSPPHRARGEEVSREQDPCHLHACSALFLCHHQTSLRRRRPAKRPTHRYRDAGEPFVR